MTFSKLICLLLPFFISKVHLPIFLPKAVLPKGDQIGFLREEEPRVLQLCLIVFALRPAGSLAHVGILSLVISANWEFWTCVLAQKLTPRRCLLLPHHEVWRLYSPLFPLPLEKLMRPAP